MKGALAYQLLLLAVSRIEAPLLVFFLLPGGRRSRVHWSERLLQVSLLLRDKLLLLKVLKVRVGKELRLLRLERSSGVVVVWERLLLWVGLWVSILILRMVHVVPISRTRRRENTVTGQETNTTDESENKNEARGRVYHHIRAWPTRP
jgi:hypothetical protein